MKSIDFSQPGGFPLTQDNLDYLQQSYSEAVTALAGVASNSSLPVLINGIQIVNPSTGFYDATAGWFFYNGELIRFNASTTSGASGLMAPYIVITQLATPLVFNDGSTPTVIFDKVATLQALPSSTSIDANRFPITALLPYGAGLGANNKEQSWNVLNVSTPAIDGGVTGSVFYKKDFIANTLHIRGSLLSANAQNFAAAPSSGFYLMGVLPAAYSPAHDTFFTSQYFSSMFVKDNLGISWIRLINSGINSGGQFYINWLKPEIAITGYGINFNTIIPLG